MPRPIVAAYYYPGYHRNAARNIRGGDGSEWPLLFDDIARRAYPDMRRPAAGARNPSAQSLSEEARLANSSGIDAFLWCWYWDRGELLLNAELDLFLKADLPAGFKYALLWVNKRPYSTLPLESPPSDSDMKSRLIETDEADFEAMIHHLVETHFNRPSYIRFENRPLLNMFLIEPLLRKLGARRLAALLERGNAIVRDRGLDGIYYVACMHHVHATHQWLARIGAGRLAGQADLGSLGFDAVTTYVLLPEWEVYTEQSYLDLVALRIRQWPEFVSRYRLPFWPSLSPGWDARARAAPHAAPPPRGHPWFPVIRDETPADFGVLLDAWNDFARQRGDVRLLPIASWNEWTEGHAIAPCTRHGEGMLRVLREGMKSYWE